MPCEQRGARGGEVEASRDGLRSSGALKVKMGLAGSAGRRPASFLEPRGLHAGVCTQRFAHHGLRAKICTPWLVCKRLHTGVACKWLHAKICTPWVAMQGFAHRCLHAKVCTPWLACKHLHAGLHVIFHMHGFTCKGFTCKGLHAGICMQRPVCRSLHTQCTQFSTPDPAHRHPPAQRCRDVSPPQLPAPRGPLKRGPMGARPWEAPTEGSHTALGVLTCHPEQRADQNQLQ